MLYLVGLGLWDEKDITLRGLDIAKKCSKVYLEEYTSKLFGLNHEALEEMIGQKITGLRRKDLEEIPAFIEEAKTQDVCVLVGGDPLVATTHADLLLRVKEAGVEYKVVHNASVISAVAETGLQAYKFGKTTTAVFWSPGYEPTSFYDVAVQNHNAGMHTLMLMDIDFDQDRYMTVNDAIKLLMNIEREKKEGLATPETMAVGIARLGSTPLIKYGSLAKLMKTDFGDPLHALILLGSLDVVESEFLDMFK